MRNAQQAVHTVAATVGFVSFAALWLGVLWGIFLRSGWALTRVRHATLYGIHQTVIMFGLTLGVVHALTQLAAPGGTVRVIDEWLPFANPDDPFGIGIGVIAAELMLALTVSVLVQRRLGYHRWRRLHTLGYAAFALLAGHVLISGSDVGPLWVKGVIAAGLVITVGLWAATQPGATKLPAQMMERVAARLRGRQVTVNVDSSRCARFGFCQHEAPDLFQLFHDGRLIYRSSVPADRVEAAVQAARVCPVRAIALGRLPNTVVISTADHPKPREVTGDRPESRS